MATQTKDTVVLKGVSSDGIRFAIVHVIDTYGIDKGFDVCKLATNHREGTRWVTCKSGMTRIAAEAYFARRTM